MGAGDRAAMLNSQGKRACKMTIRRKSFLTWALGMTVLMGLLNSCDETRHYEENHEFIARSWVVSEEPAFDFFIPDSIRYYSIYYNVRNSLDYPFARIFVTYHMFDSTGVEVSKKLTYNDLFDQKTGQPFGESGLGDLYDHQFPLLKHYRFNFPGRYSIKLDQFTRMDTLKGVIAVGIRVEQDQPSDLR